MKIKNLGASNTELILSAIYIATDDYILHMINNS